MSTPKNKNLIDSLLAPRCDDCNIFLSFLFYYVHLTHSLYCTYEGAELSPYDRTTEHLPSSHFHIIEGGGSVVHRAERGRDGNSAWDKTADCTGAG